MATKFSLWINLNPVLTQKQVPKTITVSSTIRIRKKKKAASLNEAANIL